MAAALDDTREELSQARRELQDTRGEVQALGDRAVVDAEPTRTLTVRLERRSPKARQQLAVDRRRAATDAWRW